MKTLSFNECLQIVREHQKNAPIETIPLARELGMNVYKVDDWDDDISGKIQKDDKLGGGSGYAIFVNGKHSVERRRFTIAHEIAHFILHTPLIGDGIFDDALYRSNQSHFIETEANQMAADILMPLSLIKNEYEKGATSIEKLAKIFNVSPAAMKIRAIPLKLEEIVAKDLVNNT